MLEPETQNVINEVNKLGIDYTKMPVPEARRLYNMIAVLRPKMPDLPTVDITTHVIEDSEIKIPLRIYKPTQKTNTLLPGIVYFHGGGFVFGQPQQWDEFCIMLADICQSIVVSVDYRLAPEHAFPHAVNDGYYATHWVATHADRLGIDGRKLSVAGDSAGANLACVVTLMAREHHGPRLTAQLLLYPCITLDFTQQSYIDMGQDYLLTIETMEWFWRHYLQHENDKQNPYAFPLKATHLGDLPKALIITAKYDPLHDDGQALADRLDAANVPVKYHCFETLIHGFIRNGGISPDSRQAIRETCKMFSDLLQK